MELSTVVGFAASGCDTEHNSLCGYSIGVAYVLSINPVAVSSIRDHWQKAPQTQYSCGFEGF